MSSTAIRTVLFGLTGFGNEILKAICADPRLELAAVFTRSYPTPFPYYEIPQLHELCGALHIPCQTNVRVSSGSGWKSLTRYRPDLILMAGFHQILRENVLALPRLGVVNLHPSLLPKLRGSDPIQAVLLDGEAETGVTYHYATPEVDAGNVLLQARYEVSPVETNGSLRRNLARLAASRLPQLIDQFHGTKKPPGTPQHSAPTNGNRRFGEPVRVNRSMAPRTVDRLVRALTPFPGVTLEMDGVERSVIHSEWISNVQREVARSDGAASRIILADESGTATLELGAARSGGKPY